MWTSEKFTRGQAWVDLILLANHEKGFIRKHGVRIELERGDIGWSKLKLAERWGWSRGKVDRFILELKRDNRIDIKQDNKISTVISIKNYDLYQSKGQQTGQQIEQQTGNKQDTNKKNKKNKNINININGDKKNRLVDLILDSFEKRYGFKPTDKYPRRIAWNIIQKFKTFAKKSGVKPTDEILERGIIKFLTWVYKQEWAEKIQKLETVKSKFNIYESKWR